MKRHLLKAGSTCEDEKLNTTTTFERRESVTNENCFGFIKKRKSSNTIRTHQNELVPVKRKN
jgi:hypothetical protein